MIICLLFLLVLLALAHEALSRESDNSDSISSSNRRRLQVDSQQGPGKKMRRKSKSKPRSAGGGLPRQRPSLHGDPKYRGRHGDPIAFMKDIQTWNKPNACDASKSHGASIYNNVTAAIKTRAEWSAFVEDPKNDKQVTRSHGVIKYRKRDVPIMLGPVSLECKAGLKTYGGSYSYGLTNRDKPELLDGDKITCNLADEENCLIVSIGSNNDWSFEEDIFNRTTNCQVHTFDCTLGTGNTTYMGQSGGVKVPDRLRSRVFGYNICLGADDKKIDGNDYRPWDALLKEANIKSAPSYVKMDIEGHEWSVLPAIIANSESRTLPQHIAVEIHMNHPYGPDNFYHKTMFFDYLYRVGSYHPVNFFYNRICFGCIEVLLTRLCDE